MPATEPVPVVSCAVARGQMSKRRVHAGSVDEHSIVSRRTLCGATAQYGWTHAPAGRPVDCPRCVARMAS